MEISNHGLTRINTDKMNAPLAPSLSPPGGERVATGRVRGFLFQIRVNQCPFVVKPFLSLQFADIIF